MKLAERTNRRRVSASEVIRLERDVLPDTPFHPATDISPRAWAELREAAEEVNRGEAEYVSRGLAVALLDVINPQRNLLEHTPEVLSYFQALAQSRIGGIEGNHEESRRQDLADLATMVQYFPELRDDIRQTLRRHLDIFLEQAEHATINPYFEEMVAEYIHFLQLFPDQQARIRSTFEQSHWAKNIWKADFVPKLIAQGDIAPGFVKMISNLMLLFPERADYWQEQMTSQWGPLKRYLLQQPQPTLHNPQEILAASIVGSQRAWIDQDGVLQVELKAAAPRADVPLPDRLTA